MTPSVAVFVKAFDKLSPAEKSEFHAFIAKRINSTGHARIILDEDLRKAQTINFAPAPGSCPTCGR